MEDHPKLVRGRDGGWRSPNVWARSDSIDGNPIRQLLVPSSTFHAVQGAPGALQVSNNFGTWSASTPDRALDKARLWVRLPLGARTGEPLKRAHWNLPSALERVAPAAVLESYQSAFSYAEATPGEPGLRAPQLGAIHAVLGYWTTKRRLPATVVMPTGTGKTETMLALLVAARPERLLVLVPSDALREQIAAKFETLGVLQELGIVSPGALRPVVGRVLHAFNTKQACSRFADECNVLIATPSALAASPPDVLEALLERCTHLFVDEAHHVPARTWTAVRDAFEAKPVVQFTATPFREDGRHLQGRIIYDFPLREAQAQGYFSKIDYISVVDFEDVDRVLAERSVSRLRADLEKGLDHILMVRVKGIKRANEIKPYYDRLAEDLAPKVITSALSKRASSEALKALHKRTSRVVICVNMLGEGFDLPALKVAAVHDPQKSLGVTLQFVGRFARSSGSGKYGEASVFVARSSIEIDPRLRSLYAEDSDWNLILRILTESAVQEQQELSDFEDGFTSCPEGVAVRSLLPKLSTVVYKTPSNEWSPENIVDYFGEERLFTMPIGLNAAAGVAWCVVEKRGAVRWGDLKTIEEIAYELYVLYFDSHNRLLYINNSANDGVYEDLAKAVLGDGAVRFTGSTVYRVMADIQRLVPTNVGVLDVRDRFRRFSMHVGSDVTASFSQAEAGTKTQTNISGGGYRDGEHVDISASLKGRIWTHSTASSVKHWCAWCDGVGRKLLDNTISIDHVIGQFILPSALTERPAGVLLAVEWPWSIHMQRAENLKLSLAGVEQELAFTDLVPDTVDTEGPLRFSVVGDAWAIGYEARVEHERLVYSCTEATELTVRRGVETWPLSAWLKEHGLTFILDEDRLIEGDLVYKPTWDRPPFDRAALTPLDWSGTTITVESQSKDRRADSIQFRAINELKSDESAWDIILDDDGKGEIADIVALRIDDQGLLIKLVHCKFSHEASPGARVGDLYEVCGQAQKSIVWRRKDLGPFFQTLETRARRKLQREGVSPFILGDINDLYRIQDRARVLSRRIEMVIAQPGLSAGKATTSQLDVLASTQTYLLTTINAPLEVWCSP